VGGITPGRLGPFTPLAVPAGVDAAALGLLSAWIGTAVAAKGN